MGSGPHEEVFVICWEVSQSESGLGFWLLKAEHATVVFLYRLLILVRNLRGLGTLQGRLVLQRGCSEFLCILCY
jgi:hypothetical protein